MDFVSWINLITLSIELLIQSSFSGEVYFEKNREDIANFGFSDGSGNHAMIFRFFTSNHHELVSTFVLIPWQDFGYNNRNLEINPFLIAHKFLGVNEYAIAFETDQESEFAKKLLTQMEDILELNRSLESINKRDSFTLAEGLQVIHLSEYDCFIDLQIALPGSDLTLLPKLRGIYPNKMIRMSLVPDIGPVETRWMSGDPILKPPFLDYHPKLTPDQAIDFNPNLYENFSELPSAELANLKELIKLYKKYRRTASRNPGTWVEGNMVLGAKPKEFIPSDEAFLLEEISLRIDLIVHTNQPEKIQSVLNRILFKPRKIKFTRHRIIHMDVMGSGRFFYIESMENKSFKL